MKYIKPVLVLPLILCALFVSSRAFAAEGATIQGTLVDEEKGWPLRGAAVSLIKSNAEAKTDFRGRFKLVVPAGTYAGMLIRRPGQDETVRIDAELVVEAGANEDFMEIPVPRSGAAPSSPPQTSPVLPGPSAPNPAPPTAPAPAPQPSVDPDEVRTWMGIHMQDMPGESGKPGDVSVGVLRVYEGSPAERGGIRVGDRILNLDGEPLDNFQELQKLIVNKKPGDTLRLLLKRKGVMLQKYVTLGTITVGEIQQLQPKLTNENPSDPGPAIPQGRPAPQNLPPNPPPAPAPAPQPGSQPPRQQPQTQAPQLPPLLAEARSLSKQGNYNGSSAKYDQYMRQNPNDGRALAEFAEMTFYNIQKARGMALMAQAVRKPGLNREEKSRLRLIIAERRYQGGNLLTARQMLVEAVKEDPGNPNIVNFLNHIDSLLAQSRDYHGPLQYQVHFGHGSRGAHDYHHGHHGHHDLGHALQDAIIHEIFD